MPSPGRTGQDLPWSWGATAEEVADTYPCAGRVAGPVRTLHRAVDVAADAATVFGWLCQVKRAPFSYDLLDNLGRPSPGTRSAEAERLAVGQQWAVFRIVEFEPDVHITGVGRPGPERVFGPLACTYRVRPTGTRASRLVVRLDVGVPNRLRRLTASPLAWGDLVMMRKQLRTVAELAEHQHGRTAG